MTDLNTLLEDVSRLINADAPSLADARVKMVELDDYVHSNEFESLGYSDRGRFQTAYKELRDCIRVLENPNSATGASAAPSFQTSLGGTSGQSAADAVAAADTPEAPSHNPYAEQQMEEAEKLFYGGRYAEAIKIYDQVLQIRSGSAPASTATNRRITCARATFHPWRSRLRPPAPLARPNQQRAWAAMPTPCRCSAVLKWRCATWASSAGRTARNLS